MQILDLSLVDLVSQLRSGQLNDTGRASVRIIFDAMKIELRFCKLEWCRRPFVPLDKKQRYCSKERCRTEGRPNCSDEDWNKNLRPQ